MTEFNADEALYERLQQQLASANASIEAAEVHGVVCGLLSIGQPLPADWFDELFDQAEQGDLLVSECRQQIESIYDLSLKTIENNGIGMRLLLPTDTVVLPLRARAVTEWCQGFLYGLGMAGEKLDGLSEESREAMKDIGSVSQMDLNALGASDSAEEEEQALTEITEFLWVAAMLIRENITGKITGSENHSHEYH